MTAAINPAASHHLPSFITPPGQTDMLMVVSLFVLLGATLAIGVFYFKLHGLPEQVAHRGEKIQYQFVALLSLIALFTHNHFYWILALLIAFVHIPDFSTPITEMAKSLARIADAKVHPPAPAAPAPAAPPAPPAPAAPKPAAPAAAAPAEMPQRSPAKPEKEDGGSA